MVKGQDYTRRLKELLPYSKIRKFLMARVGRPVDKVYSEFLQEGSKYAQIRNLQEVFNEFIY